MLPYGDDAALTELWQCMCDYNAPETLVYLAQKLGWDGIWVIMRRACCGGKRTPLHFPCQPVMPRAEQGVLDKAVDVPTVYVGAARGKVCGPDGEPTTLQALEAEARGGAHMELVKFRQRRPNPPETPTAWLALEDDLAPGVLGVRVAWMYTGGHDFKVWALCTPEEYAALRPHLPLHTRSTLAGAFFAARGQGTRPVWDRVVIDDEKKGLGARVDVAAGAHPIPRQARLCGLDSPRR